MEAPVQAWRMRKPSGGRSALRSRLRSRRWEPLAVRPMAPTGQFREVHRFRSGPSRVPSRLDDCAGRGRWHVFYAAGRPRCLLRIGYADYPIAWYLHHRRGLSGGLDADAGRSLHCWCDFRTANHFCRSAKRPRRRVPVRQHRPHFPHRRAQGYWGPNFLFSVPEPSSCAVLLTTTMICLGRRSKVRR